MKLLVTNEFGEAQPRFVDLAFSGFACFLVAELGVNSPKLALPFALLGSTAPIFFARHKNEKRRTALSTIWPELIDHMISGLRAGLSIAETICSLSHRGPQESRKIFEEVETRLKSGEDLTSIFTWMKQIFANPIADQVCEVLDFARGSGSRDTSLTLRTLGDFIRSDIAVRGEVQAKLGWVKNSAVVAAIAPWILLLILSAQPTTVAAFSTPTGFMILGIGVLLSVIAYLWMGKVGAIPGIPRIFAGSEPDSKKSAKGTSAPQQPSEVQSGPPASRFSRVNEHINTPASHVARVNEHINTTGSRFSRKNRLEVGS